MNTKLIYQRAGEITLFIIIMLLPFSYHSINIQWCVLLSILLGICLTIFFIKKIKPANHRILVVFFSICSLIIFDVSENVTIIKQIPLSSLLISIAMILFLIKILLEGRIKIFNHPFIVCFFFSCVFLFFLMILFFPFFYLNYQMSFDTNIQLFSKIVKYLMIIILVINYLSDEKKLQIFNFGIISSLFVTIFLFFIL